MFNGLFAYRMDIFCYRAGRALYVTVYCFRIFYEVIVIAYQKEIRDLEAVKDNLFPNIEHELDFKLKDTEIRQIDFKTASTIIYKYEWLKSMPHRFAYRVSFGIYFKNILGGAVVFAQPATRSKSLFGVDYGTKSIIQLSRGACQHWTPCGTASRLIIRSLKKLKLEGVRAAIAYCTPEAGEIGTIYQACGFLYLGLTKPSKEYFIDKRWIGERSFAHKLKWLNGLPEGDKKEKYSESFKNLKTREVLPRHKYLYVLNRKDKKLLIPETYPYPKRNAIEVSKEIRSNSVREGLGQFQEVAQLNQVA